MRAMLIALAMLVCLPGCGGCRYIQDAQDTAFGEFKASTLLKKYEWFKDAAAQCEAKLASLKAYEARQKSLQAAYAGDKRQAWSREDREQSNLWEQEKAGIKASYNNLAAEYNAQMSKFNYAFCNAGSLPQGATQPLPREFKPYVED